MPQDGSQNYFYPPGTRGITDETIESAAYNNFLDDLVDHDLNIARPIHRGGTGATTADQALINLGAEKAAQLVTNYDSHVWLPGSFRSAAGATAAPVADHAFAGIVYLGEPFVGPPTNANVVVSARDLNDTVVPSRVYVREKKANVWGPWTVLDATTLPFPPGGGLDATTILEAIQELDAEKAAITYVDAQDAALAASKVSKIGDTMTGALTLPGDPTLPLHASTKQYVDARMAGLLGSGRSRVINGAMQISQQNGDLASTGANYYAADEWFTAFSALTTPIESQRIGSNGLYRYRIRNTATNPALTGNEYAKLTTHIEGTNIVDFNWGLPSAKQIVLRFGFVGPAGTYSISCVNHDSTRSYVANFTITAPQAGLDTEQTFVIPGDTTGSWRKDIGIGLTLNIVLAAGPTYHGVLGWQTAGFGKLGTAANTHVLGATNMFFVYDVGLYLDTLSAGAAPKWEMPDPITELSKCQRYWEKSYNYDVAAGASDILAINGSVAMAARAASATATAGNGVGFRFKCSKRSTPTTFLFSATSGVQARISISPTGAAGYVDAVSSIAGVGRDGVQAVYTSSTSGMTAGQAVEICFHYTANARL